MLQSMMSSTKIAVLAAVLLLTAAERSDAQAVFFGGNRGGLFGFGPSYYYPYNYGGYYPNYGYGSPYFYFYTTPSYYMSTYVQSAPRLIYVPPVTTTSAEAEQPGKPAKIEVTLPANAELWFDGKKSTQTGATRYFATPPLYATQVNSYELRATWTDETGTLAIRNRTIQVQPGEKVAVNLNQPES